MISRLLVAYIFLLILCIGSAAVAFYKYYKYSVYSDGRQNMQQQSVTSMAQIDNCLNAMEQAIVDVLSDSTFVDTWQKAAETKDEEDALEVRRILTKAYCNKSNIRRIAVYGVDGTFFCTGIVTATAEKVQRRCFMIRSNYSMEAYSSKVYLSPHTDFWHKESETTVISEIKSIKDSKGNLLGYIEAQQNIMYLEKTCNLKWNGEPIDVMLFKGSIQDVFYMNLPYTEENRKYAQEVQTATQAPFYFQEDEKAIYTSAFSNVSPVKLVLVMDKASFIKSTHSIFWGIIVVSILLIFITVLYSGLTTRMITAPINRLARRVEQMDLNNLNQRLDVVQGDKETQILVNAFEKMVDRIQESMARQKKLEAAQTKALFSVLQSTMGPHFLYNSLGGIANLCERGENEEAADVCYSLTEILRYANDYKNSEVRIQDEIENVNDYISIMKSRYRQRIEFDIRVDEDAMDIMIPKLTLQPFIENAIRYSLLEQETVIVQVYVLVFHNWLFIEIKDNGCGISEEKAKEIQQKIRLFRDNDEIESQKVKFGGLGLVGTMVRLEIYYGDNFKYEIQSNNDKGGASIQFGTDISKYR